MVGNYPHASGVAVVFLATQIFELFNDWLQKTNSEHIWAVDLSGSDSL